MIDRIRMATYFWPSEEVWLVRIEAVYSTMRMSYCFPLKTR